MVNDIGFTTNYYVDAGGDVQVSGRNSKGKLWEVGIQDPFGDGQKVVKVIYADNIGIATSGTYIRGKHVYDPLHNYRPADAIVSLTVIGPNVYEADRFATAAFAMGMEGIYFIEKLSGFEGYMIDAQGIATMTSGFKNYTKANAE